MKTFHCIILALVVFRSGFDRTFATEPKMPAPRLSLVAQSGETVAGNVYSFDFGIEHLMDPTQKIKDIRDEESLKTVSPGLKHDFILQNNTKTPLVISSANVRDEECFELVEARIFKNDHVQSEPYIVKPSAKVRIRVAFDYYKSLAGPQALSVRVMGKGLKAPLAILTLAATIKSGVELASDAANFGRVLENQSMSHDFTLTFDRRSPRRIPPSPLRILSSNPYVKIVAVPEKQIVNEVEINGDQILFPSRRIPNFKEDMVLNFRAILSPDAPIGPLSGEIRLRVVDAPNFLIVRDAVAPISGEVIAGPKPVEAN